MAESVLFGVASELLSTISTEAFKGAVGSVRSIWHARDELATLKMSIETIRAVLVDAEKRQDGFDAIKNWTKKVKDVLYDADDLFDEVTTDDMLTQEIEDTVKVSCCKFHPVSRNYLIAKKVKAIRKRLDQIARDMAPFEFVPLVIEDVIPGGSKGGRDPGSFVDAKGVIGRDEDKKVILEMLFNESNHAQTDVPLVIAIVGIGGMGKTTLAQLIYNDIEVQKKFEECWFACISNTSDDKEVLSKICQAICRENCNSFTVSDLQFKIREKIKEKKFLLVLDDVWDDHRAHARWQARMSLLGGGAKESKVIVTTRSPLVATSLNAASTHTLSGLSAEDSWDLFKRVAFAPGNENDPRRIDLGKKIIEKCRNVPLAIKSIGSLLFEKNTIQEWESIEKEKLPKLGKHHDDDIIPVLKLSYDHLPWHLKQCFAYCSLFPEDYEIDKDKLVYLWMTQGYIGSNNKEDGHSCFMYLLRRGFFQETKEADFGEIKSCKMHDLIRDLAIHVGGDAIVMLSTSSDTANYTRHVSVDDRPNDSWGIPASLINANRLRSFLFMNGGLMRKPVLDELLGSFKVLRTLGLSCLGLNTIPSCIGELKHLRYLDLSINLFESVPDSMTNLVSLVALNFTACLKLKRLPDNFRKLINIRYLHIYRCDDLKHMPPGIEELTRLEYLSDFKVGKSSEGVKRSGIDALSGLQQLREKLSICFDREIENWEGDGCWQLPVLLQKLRIDAYPGSRIPQPQPNLASLELSNCYNLKDLPPLRCLPNLRFLTLIGLDELEYVEEEEGSSNAFFPCLEELRLFSLPNLKGWRREAADEHLQQHSFPPLHLQIQNCEKLKYLTLSLSSRIQKLQVRRVQGELIQHILSTSPSSLVEICMVDVSNLMVLHLTLPHLQTILIQECSHLTSVHLEALPSLRSLKLESCHGLKNVHIALPNLLEELLICGCYELELWKQDEDKSSSLNWDCLPNLRRLYVDSMSTPPSQKLPHCLQHLHVIGQLQILLIRDTKSCSK